VWCRRGRRLDGLDRDTGCCAGLFSTGGFLVYADGLSFSPRLLLGGVSRATPGSQCGLTYSGLARAGYSQAEAVPAVTAKIGDDVVIVVVFRVVDSG
jgi:hypothetical protein